MAGEYGLDDDAFTQANLLGSLMLFQRTFFELRMGAKFELSYPIGRECRHVTMCRALKRVFRGECKRLMINIPPRYAKTEWAIGFVAWALAHYPDSKFIYVSYSQSVATNQTQAIRDIITLPYYKAMFDVELDPERTSRHDWGTTAGGRVFAAGAEGSITSRGAGVQGVNRFGGCILIDDIHKPEEVYSDVSRQTVNDWYYRTLSSRLNDPINTPIILIGQMLHEDDLPSNLRLLKKPDGTPEWEVVSIPVCDDAGNMLDETKHTKAMFKEMMEREPYVTSAQYQQNPLPAGGGIFKKDDFILLPNEPDILTTFITADTAETEKDYNDFSAFSFWGLYRIVIRGVDTGMYGLHWIDNRAIHCEPKDLENEFFDFYASCMRHKVKPTVSCIEKKSTGVTLASILKGTPGLRIIALDRNAAGGSKTDRFLACQPFVNSHRITFTEGAKHAVACIEHCSKITANNSHRNDDIADTMQQAIQVAFIEGQLKGHDRPKSQLAEQLTAKSRKISELRQTTRL